MEYLYWNHTRNVLKSFVYQMRKNPIDKYELQLKKLIFILKCYSVFLKNIKKKKIRACLSLADQRPLIQDYLNISTRKNSTYLFGGVISNFYMIRKSFTRYKVLWERLPALLIVFNYEPNQEIIKEAISKTLPIIVIGTIPSVLEQSLWCIPYNPVLLKEFFFFSKFFSRFF